MIMWAENDLQTRDLTGIPMSRYFDLSLWVSVSWVSLELKLKLQEAMVLLASVKNWVAYIVTSVWRQFTVWHMVLT